MTASTGRHRAPEPPPAPSGPSALFAFWALLLTVVTVGSALVGLLTGSINAWAVFTGTVVFDLFTVWVTKTSQPVSPRVKREAAYVGRTAERAAVWYGVWRVLGGLFGR